MNTLKSTLLPLTLALITANAQAADWTPYLKSIQDSCGESFSDVLFKEKSMPKALKGDIVSHKINKQYGHRATLTLKNASAFGYPIKKIDGLRGYGEAYFSITFAKKVDSKALLSSFGYRLGKQFYTVGQPKAFLIKYSTDNEYHNYHKTDEQGNRLPPTAIKELSKSELAKIKKDAYLGYEEAYEKGYHEFLEIGALGWHSHDHVTETSEYLSFNPKTQTLKCSLHSQ